MAAKKLATRTTRTNTFTKGSGAYKCACCTRLTRDDGNGDSVNLKLCSQCFDIAGLENHLNDTGELSVAEAQDVRSKVAFIESVGGKYPMDATTAAKIAELLDTPPAPVAPAKKASRKIATRNTEMLLAAGEAAVAQPDQTTTHELKTPLLVVTEKTRYGVAFREQDGTVHVLNTLAGFYDVSSMSRAEFTRNWDDVETLEQKGRVPATLARYIDAMSTTTIEATPAALDALKEIQMANSEVIIAKTGHVLTKSVPGALVLTFGGKNNVERLTAFLTERTRGVFVKAALKLDVAPVRIKDGDERLAAAVKAVIGDRPAVAAETVARVARKVANKSASAGASTEPKKASLKQRLHDALKAGTTGTVDSFVKLLDGTESSVKTALSDLKNPKYGIDGKALNIAKDDKGVYSLAKGPAAKK